MPSTSPFVKAIVAVEVPATLLPTSTNVADCEAAVTVGLSFAPVMLNTALTLPVREPSVTPTAKESVIPELLAVNA